MLELIIVRQKGNETIHESVPLNVMRQTTFILRDVFYKRYSCDITTEDFEKIYYDKKIKSEIVENRKRAEELNISEEEYYKFRMWKNQQLERETDKGVWKRIKSFLNIFRR